MKKLLTTILSLALAASLASPAVAESARLERMPLPEAAASASTTYARFRDVAATYWGRDGISYVVDKGLFNGTGSDTFSPDLTMSRAMLCTVLHRFAGLPAVSGASGYSDVPEGKWYSDGVAWAKQNAILPSWVLDADKIDPDGGMTRGEFCVMLFNFYKQQGGSAYADELDLIAQQFPDLPIRANAYPEHTAVSWAYVYSIVNGTSDSTFSPDTEVTRAQMAAMLERYDRQFGAGTPSATVTEPKQAEDPAQSEEDRIEDELIQLINDYRAENGLTRLNKNEKLMEAADVRVQEISTKFSHVRPNGEHLGILGEEFGADDLSVHWENIAGAGDKSAKAIFEAWKKSAGHNKTMLTKDTVTEIGVGVNSQGYAVMLFAEYWK